MVCRLCLCEYPSNKLRNVFLHHPKNSEESLVWILYWVFSVEVDVIDPYPKEACEQCLVLIEHVLQIRETFQKTQDVLKGKEPKKNLNYNTLQEIRKDRNILGYKRVSEVKVSLNNLELICPITLDIPKFEQSPEFADYEHLGLGKYRKRDCVRIEPAQGEVKLKVEMVSEGTNTDLIIPVGMSNFEKNMVVKPNGCWDLKKLQMSTGHNMVDLLEIATHISSMVSSNKPPVKDASTNTDTPSSQILTNHNLVKVDSNSLRDNFSLKPYVEPVEHLLDRENYSEVRKNCFVKDFQGDLEADTFGDENEKEGIAAKKQRVLNYYNNFRSFAARELIEGKPVRENASSDLLLNVAEVENVFMCNFCTKTFSSSFALKMHAKAHKLNKPDTAEKEEKTFRCLLCQNKGFSSGFGLKMHHVKFHKLDWPNEEEEASVFNCIFCSKTFSTSFDLKMHAKAHNLDKPDDAEKEEEKTFRCLLCKKTFSSGFGLKMHAKAHKLSRPKGKEKRRFKCDICSKTFSSRRYVNRHVKFHNSPKKEKIEQRLFKCHFCFRAYFTIGGRTLHEREFHADLYHRPAPKPQKQCPTRKRRNDQKKKKAQCPICTAQFSVPSIYSHILNAHWPPRKKVKCKYCRRVFHYEPVLKCHMSIVHNKKYVPAPEGAQDPAKSLVASPFKRQTRRKMVATYNIDDIMESYRYRWGVKTKEKKLLEENSAKDLVPEDATDADSGNYIWNRTKLGTYSAVSFYEKYVDKSPVKNDNEEKEREICVVVDEDKVFPQQKTDVALNQTIQKLAERLVDPLELAARNSEDRTDDIS